jgi:hypothetical protein
MLNGLFLLSVALTAIDRTAFGRFEGDLSLFTAFSAGNRVHLSGAASVAIAILALFRSALGAAGGIILQTMRLIKLLFTTGKHEFLTAFATAQSFFFQSHRTAPPNNIVSLFSGTVSKFSNP